MDNISFDVNPGEILGFLGPNGAGKSTSMKMITGFLAMDVGEISVCGFDVQTQTRSAQQQIGYLPEGAPCYEDMTTRQFLEFVAEIRGFRKREKARRVESVIENMNLESVWDQRIGTLSKGFKRRVGLGQALLHDPRVLILDEPTDGLDPNQKHHVREMIRGLSQDKIVIISTHILEEVTAVCTRAMIIDDGRVVKDCTPAELEARSRFHGAVTVELGNPAGSRHLFAGLSQVEQVEVDELNSRITLFARHGMSIINQVTNKVHEQQLDVEGIYVERGRLDDVFRSVTRGDT